ncbi:unnamed protein product [Toxocara canis]|uniref:LAM_G_DOMAIN domain-containing protein n=1 Tax=Toxocara canis TaxID=6265 RepID=A0A183V5N8_TOXCA|nr:unnamed protein product [Toxocara canis]
MLLVVRELSPNRVVWFRQLFAGRLLVLDFFAFSEICQSAQLRVTEKMADRTVTRFCVNQLRKRDSFEGQPNHRDHQWTMLFDSFGLPNPATAAETHLTTPAEVPAQRTKPQPSECPKMSNTAQPPHRRSMRPSATPVTLEFDPLHPTKEHLAIPVKGGGADRLCRKLTSDCETDRLRIKMFAVAAVLLLLLLQCVAYKDLPMDLSLGKKIMSPPHPDEFSKSLVGMKNSIVYGIRKTDGLLMVIEQQHIDQIHDLATMQSMLDLPLGYERFEYCQVLFSTETLGSDFSLTFRSTQLLRLTVTEDRNGVETYCFNNDALSTPKLYCVKVHKNGGNAKKNMVDIEPI